MGFLEKSDRLSFGEVFVEPVTDPHSLADEKYVARVHLGLGPENMRFAYSATAEEASSLLVARLEREGVAVE